VNDPTETPRSRNAVVGNIFKIKSEETFATPTSIPGQAQGTAVDLAYLDQGHDASGQKAPQQQSDDVHSSVPRHHNQDNLCLPHSTCWETTLTCCSLMPWCWLSWCNSFHRLSNREEAAVYFQGVPYAHVSAPQQLWLCINPCLDVSTFSKNQYMVNLDEVRAADADGSPIVLSGVVTYTIGDPWRYFTASAGDSWLRNQGLVVLKEVASRYPYDAAPGQVSLRTRGSRNVVVKTLKSEMQQRCKSIGLKIRTFEFTDMHYAKEVAAQMLVTQQAKATVNARRLIVDGAVSIVTETVSRLEGEGISFTAQQKADLVRSLLVMSVSDSPAQTTVAV